MREERSTEFPEGFYFQMLSDSLIDSSRREFTYRIVGRAWPQAYAHPKLRLPFFSFTMQIHSVVRVGYEASVQEISKHLKVSRPTRPTLKKVPKYSANLDVIQVLELTVCIASTETHATLKSPFLR
jgi:hypothetical protein